MELHKIIAIIGWTVGIILAMILIAEFRNFKEYQLNEEVPCYDSRGSRMEAVSCIKTIKCGIVEYYFDDECRYAMDNLKPYNE